MKSSLTIRVALLDEAESIARLLQSSFAEFEPLYTPAAFAATTPATQQIRARWNEGPVWVAEQNKNILATVAAVQKSSGFYLRSMAVHPDARGQGIATKLLHTIEDYAINHSQERLFLSTTPFLGAAIRLYERFGFRRTGESPHELFGTPLFTMEKRLQTKEADETYDPPHRS